MDSTPGIARGLLAEVEVPCARREETTTSSPQAVEVVAVTQVMAVRAVVRLVRTATVVGELARLVRVELRLPEVREELVRMGTRAFNTQEAPRDWIPAVHPKVAVVVADTSVVAVVETTLVAVVDRALLARSVGCNQEAPRQETDACLAQCHPSTLPSPRSAELRASAHC
jgi:hypothetical protein